jgi:hypothetical protein
MAKMPRRRESLVLRFWKIRARLREIVYQFSKEARAHRREQEAIAKKTGMRVTGEFRINGRTYRL